MNHRPTSDITFEPERYELYAEPVYQFEAVELDRRNFFKLLGGGIAIVSLFHEATAQESGARRRRGRGRQMPPEIGAWLHINEEGVVTAFTGKAEVGQNIRTSLSQVIAEELKVPLPSIHMVMGDTELTPYDAGTFGSRTTPVMAAHLRKISAAAREILIELAAEALKVEPATLSVSDGKVTHRESKRSLDYGQLSKGKELLKSITGDEQTIPADQWKIAGTSVPKVDGRSFVTGEHKYASDIILPGMLYGKILRPIAFGALLASIDTQKAEAIPGITVVREGDFVGVIASTVKAAEQALRSIDAEWKSPTGQISNKELFEHLRGKSIAPGSIQESSNPSNVKLTQTYTVEYIAHVPLEPRAAVAQWEGNKLTVWTGTQRPFGVQSDLARAFQMPESQVRVIVPDTGSGYGGKHTVEAATEAARLARSAGKPVKLVWTREEEFTWAYFRPAGVIDIAAEVRSDGTIGNWEFHNYNSGRSAVQSPYNIPGQKTEFHRSDSPLRQGSYRCLAATANNFARESFMDELAHAAQIDPLEFRLKNLKNERLRNVFLAAAEKIGWKNRKQSKNHGWGIAGGTEKGGYVATCAEISVDRSNGEVKVIRVVEAFECGAVLNPDHLRNQIEGMVVMGLGGALFESIQFADGKIRNARMARYRVPRFRDNPPIETILLDRKDLPSAGAGECPIIGIAPAVGNAIFDAAGIRLRSLPMIPNGLKV